MDNNLVREVSHGDNLDIRDLKVKVPKRRKRVCPKMGMPRKLKIFFKTTAQTGDSFFSQSSIHGTQYIADFNDPYITDPTRAKYARIMTKVLWSIAVGLGAACCLYMMELVYDRYKTTPTVTSIETSTYPIYLVPFPAVTICNINKVYAPNSLNITQTLIKHGIDNDTIEDFYQKLAALVNPEFIEGIYLKIYIILESMGYDSEKLMQELAQPCESMLKTCLWLGKRTPCTNLFRMIETTSGFCCSFNFRALKEDFDAFDFHNISHEDDPPIYVMGAGKSVGLSVLLDAEEESYLAVTRRFYGIEVTVHDPEEMPPNVVTAIVQPEQDLNLAILPSVVISEPDIRDLPFEQRLCYFEDERKLRTSNKYSFQSCIAECRVDTILDRCNCIPFYFPETHLQEFIKHYRQCSLRDVNCLRLNRYVLSSMQPPPNTTGFKNSDAGMNCKCYPNCSGKQYLVSTLLGQKFNSKLTSQVFGDIDMQTFSTVHIYFQDLTCIKYRRGIYMPWDALFSSFGGIFGFCLGGSILSVVELIYFFTFKFLVLFKNNSIKKEPTLSPRSNPLEYNERNIDKFVPTINMTRRMPEYAGKFKSYRGSGERRDNAFVW